MLRIYIDLPTLLNELEARPHDGDGQTMVESTILAGLITIVAIVAITAVGVKVGGIWGDIKSAIGA